MISANVNPYCPHPAKIIARRQESRTIFTITTEFTESAPAYAPFSPGQFNMVYLYGVGEVAISISSDPAEQGYLSHTIRAVGRVTKALEQQDIGDEIGIRGPYGQGWPLDIALGKDILIVTGGLGCAPTVSAINYIIKRRADYGNLTILQGVKHSDDFIFRNQYALWQKTPNTVVHIAADQAGPHWPWDIGYVTNMISALPIDPKNTIVMMCGPERMMHTAIQALIQKNVSEAAIYLSMERNMQCGIGLCGHCQYGDLFLCKDGPVVAYPRIKALFSIQGF